MELSNLEKIKGLKRAKKTIGRGIGSGKGGHTVGRGNKGQKARSGSHKPWAGFEGGQVPLYKRLPQLRGFRVYGKIDPTIINISMLNNFEDGTEVTVEKLLSSKVLNEATKVGVKILGNGELKKKLTLKGFTYSTSAREKIEKAGSKIVE
jgi:large subunit ribosomal protein L15